MNHHKQIAQMGGSFFCVNFFLLLCLFAISTTLTKALNGGFSVELIHRDSSKSPFYIPSETPYQRVADAIKRSINGANNHFFKTASSSSFVTQNTPESSVISIRGEYLMSYSIGSPPFQVMGIVDTGSDLVWLQCLPCENCYNQTTPVFNPSNSHSYHNIPCDSNSCQATQGTATSCSNSGNICQYSINYSDDSMSQGDLSWETLTLGSTSGTPIPFLNAVFGCGHNNQLRFQGKTTGIVGLGKSSLSLVSQMGPSIGGKFSYCLVPVLSQPDISSKLSFGNDAVVSGPGTVSTPLASKKGFPDYFYLLTLEAISVENNRIDFGSSSSSDAEGNIIIDSGTTLTLLPDDFYSELESAVADLVKLERVQDPSNVMSLCYGVAALANVQVPVITAHFKGADVILNALNTFVQVSDDVICFAFHAAGPLGSVFGNLAQMNFKVGYDLEMKSVSFMPTDCTKQ